MLGKMIKYEFNATGRLCVPLFIIVAVLTPILSLLGRLATALGEKSIAGTFVGGISNFSFIIMMIGLCVGVVIFVAMRFYRTVATSEAYLTFCLPVNQHHILISKFIVAIIWEIISFAVAFIAVYVMLLIQGIIAPGDILHKLSTVLPFLNGSTGTVVSYLIQIGLCLFASLIAGTLSCFLAVCLGQLFNEHRVIASIGCYLGIYMVVQIVSLLVMLPFILPYGMEMGRVDLINLDQNIPMHIFDVASLLNICLGVVFYLVSAHLLKKRVNVR